MGIKSPAQSAVCKVKKKKLYFSKTRTYYWDAPFRPSSVGEQTGLAFRVQCWYQHIF